MQHKRILYAEDEEHDAFSCKASLNKSRVRFTPRGDLRKLVPMRAQLNPSRRTSTIALGFSPLSATLTALFGRRPIRSLNRSRSVLKSLMRSTPKRLNFPSSLEAR